MNFSPNNFVFFVLENCILYNTHTKREDSPAFYNVVSVYLSSLNKSLNGILCLILIFDNTLYTNIR